MAAALSAFAVVIVTSWYFTAPYRGWLAAQIDVRRGHYRLLTYGLPARGYSEYARVLQERYRIEVKAVAGCVVSGPLVAYVDRYDRVSSAAANLKFGHDVFNEAWKHAQDEIGSAYEGNR